MCTYNVHHCTLNWTIDVSLYDYLYRVSKNTCPTQKVTPYIWWLKTSITRVVINIFWPNCQDMCSIVWGTSPSSFIHFWASLDVRYFSPIPPVLDHFHVTHSLNLCSLLITKTIWVHFDEKCQSYAQFMANWKFITITTRTNSNVMQTLHSV